MTKEAAKERATVHELKTWPEFFGAVQRGEKAFEIRVNDRNYRVGDVLVLHEYEPEAGRYTREVVARRVTYIAQGVFGLPPDVCVMSLAAATVPADERESDRDVHVFADAPATIAGQDGGAYKLTFSELVLTESGTPPKPTDEEVRAAVSICQSRLRSGNFGGEYFADAVRTLIAAVSGDGWASVEDRVCHNCGQSQGVPSPDCRYCCLKCTPPKEQK